MCGVSACENRQNRVSHGESVRVGSSATNRSSNSLNKAGEHALSPFSQHLPLETLRCFGKVHV